VAPARVLARQPQHELPNLTRQPRPSAPASGLPPLPTHQRPMPAQKRSWCHQKQIPRRARQVARCGCQQRPINRAELRPRDLPTQDLELVAQHQQLDVFHMQPATAANERTEQSPHSEVDEGEGHAGDPPSLRPIERRHQFWRLQAARRGPRAGKADGESDVLAKIAEMPERDRAMAKRLHAIIKASAPALSPRTWYGMPAYANDGKVVCFFQSAQKFKTRYATFGFSDKANLDEGAIWPTAFALTELTAAEEAKIAALVKKAVS
jgi:uncharacterized protein YdhG (YjbR/CyaY superfamily)